LGGIDWLYATEAADGFAKAKFTVEVKRNLKIFRVVCECGSFQNNGQMVNQNMFQTRKESLTENAGGKQVL